LSLKKSELMTSIPLSSCQFEKICIRFSLRFLKKSESTLVGSYLLKGDTWPAETRVLSRGRKREDPGNEVAHSVTSRHFAPSRVEWAGGECLGTRLGRRLIKTPNNSLTPCGASSKGSTFRSASLVLLRGFWLAEKPTTWLGEGL